MAFPIRVVVALATVTFVATAAQGQTTWFVDGANCPDPGSGTQADPFCMIQDGIDATLNGDEVAVGPGTYNETINFDGKAITVRSANGPAVTTIDGTGLNDSVVKCVSGEGPQTILLGFTVSGGSSGGGRCMFISGESNPTLTNCTFRDGTAVSGGGMSISQSSNPTLTNCTFSDNTAENGGGMFIRGASTPTLVNCDFNDNTATEAGGGLMVFFQGFPTLTNCRFAGNSARYGGGIATLTDGMHKLTLTSCLFTGNSAVTNGGGIYGEGIVSGPPTLTNCTFSGNTAGGAGGGIYNLTGQRLILTNCILWGNSDSGGTDESAQVDGDLPIVTYCAIQGWTDGPFSTIGNIDADPLFVDPDGSDNIVGTPDDDLRLMPESPCIDAANNTAVPTDVDDLDGDGVTDEPIPFDLNGNPRFWDALTEDSGNGVPPIVDMGAYEQVDCNGNGIRDDLDIFPGTSQDCTGNGFPDECEPDCNMNGVADSCDLAAGTSDDCTGNGVPDECEPDCNNNGVADSCDLAAGISADCTGNGVPDECEPDCNNNAVADSCDILDGTTDDVNGNGVPDQCDPVIYVRAGATGANDGSSWPNAYNELRDALEAWQFGSTIWVAGGTYKPAAPSGERTASFRLLSGVTMYGGFGGAETRLDQRDPTVNPTILSGDLNGDDSPVACALDTDCDLFGESCIDGFCIVKQNNSENSLHVVIGSDTDATAVLDGFTITAGNADLSGFESRIGSGMYIFFGSPTVSGCTFARNARGGMFSDYGSPRVSGCTFARNAGGGVRNWQGDPILTKCTFIENTALLLGAAGGFFEGGGMYSLGGSPKLLNCTFIANEAYRGGGMRIQIGTATLTNCTFAGNSSAIVGGGLSTQSSGVPTQTLTLTNCLFTGNSAAVDGGGIDNHGPMTLTNCTFSGNSADSSGGGLYSFIGTTLVNCILWGNIVAGAMDESAQLQNRFGALVVDYTSVQGWTGSLGGTGNTGDDPLFVDPDGADDIPGTDDDNLRLLAGSAAIDAADNTAVPSDSADLDGDGDLTERTPVDLDGNPRFQDDLDTVDTGVDDLPTYPDVVDMGAYEFQVCGNARLDLDEECDDGNTESGDGCDETCRIEFGACCVASACNVTSEADCSVLSGNFFGFLSTCDLPDACDLEPPILAPAPHDILKNRYISIDPRGANEINAGKDVDIRLTLTNTLVNGVMVVGSEWWANAPDANCIAVVGPTRPALPPNWNACPTLHLAGCPIIPTSTYEIVAVVGGLQSDPPLAAATQARPGVKWHGDCVGFFTGTEWTAPNGTTSIDDAVAAIKTFQNPSATPGCPAPPCNATHVSVTDMVPNLTPGPQINSIVNIADVFSIILGFQGFEYPGPDLTQCP